MTSDQQVFEQALAVLGYTPDDKSVEAERARVWINGTLDQDEYWFDGRSADEVRQSYARWCDYVNDNT